MAAIMADRNGLRAALAGWGSPALLAAVLALPLGACSGAGWPSLSDVTRPLGSDAPADVGETATKTPEPAKTAPAAEVTARLDALEAEFATHDKAVAAAYADYLARLDRLLAGSGDPETLVGNWTAAQSSLSRMSVAMDSLKTARDAMAGYALDLTKAGGPALIGVAERVAGVGGRFDARRAVLDLETNRLSVLTPASIGAPGPAAVSDTGRTALATIRFADGNPAFAADLGRAVKGVQGSVPDVAFDVIASGPEGTQARQQDALRHVAAALRQSGVESRYLTLAMAAPAAGAAADPAVTVRVYLRKRSL